MRVLAAVDAHDAKEYVSVEHGHPDEKEEETRLSTRKRLPPVATVIAPPPETAELDCPAGARPRVRWRLKRLSVP